MGLTASRATVTFLWLAVTAAYAWWFIGTAAAPEGYPLADNAFAVFALVRLPFFMFGLALTLWWVGRTRNV